MAEFNRFVRSSPSSDFLTYLAFNSEPGVSEAQLPSLNEISKELRVSVATLREQLEVARALGLVEVRPRTGIRRLPYAFLPTVRQSLSYAISLDQAYFESYAELRNHLEASYWHEAVRNLQPEDLILLQNLLRQAREKLNGNPIQIPHSEHRQLHLTIFIRLNNVFVQGILEAFWEAYEAIGLNVYADYSYLQQVWNYHQQMVNAIAQGNYHLGYQALVDHKDLLHHRPVKDWAGESSVSFQPFQSKEDL